MVRPQAYCNRADLHRELTQHSSSSWQTSFSGPLLLERGPFLYNQIMQLPLVITGSLAYDHVMTFPGKFADHILPDKVHMLSVAFTVETLQTSLGGCAGNIAYNLSLLGEASTVHAVIGSDGAEYLARLRELGVVTNHILKIDNQKTAQAFVMTDLADNQITAFHPGAMTQAFTHPLRDIPPSLVIISPNQKTAMMLHATHCQKAGLDFIFDPGQAFADFTGEELIASLRGARALTVNDYEWELWQEKTGLKKAKTLELTEAIIITLGEKGAHLITRELDVKIPAVPDCNAVDPTGCGDAFRAGLLYALKRQKSWPDAVKFANAVASFAVEFSGTQNHIFTEENVAERYAVVDAGH